MKFSGRESILLALCLTVLIGCGLFSGTLFTDRVALPTDFLRNSLPWRTTASPPRVKTPALSDVTDYFYPAESYFRESLFEGRVPLWNPRQLTGYPFAASGQAAVFYPPHVLLTLLLKPADEMEINALLHVILAGFFMFLMLRGFGCRTESALIGGAAYMLSGWMAAWMMFPSFLMAAAWAPLAFLFFDRALSRGSGRMAVAAGAALGICSLTGYPPMTIYICLALGVYGAVFIVAPGKPGSFFARFARIAGAYLATIAVGFLVGSVQWLQTIELARESSRIRHQLEGALGLPLYPHNLLTLFLPDVFGNVGKGTALPRPYEYLEKYAYAGTIVFCLAVSSAGLWRNRRTAGWLAVAAIGLVGAVALGWTQPGFYIPGMYAIRANRLLFLAAFAVAALAATAWEGVLRSRDEKGGGSPMIPLGWGAGLMAGAGFLLWNLMLREREFHPTNPGAFLEPSLIRSAVAIGCLFIAVALRRVRGGAASWIVLCAVVLELGFAARGMLPVGDPKLVFPETQSIHFLLNQRETCRFHGDLYVLFPPNAATVFGFQDVRGYEPMNLSRYADLAHTLNSNKYRRKEAYSEMVFPAVFGGPLMRLMNVCYYGLVSPPGGGLELVDSSDFRIYRDPGALRRALFYGSWRVVSDSGKILEAVTSSAFQPEKELYLEASPGVEMAIGGATGTAIIARYSPEAVDIDVDSSGPGLVFLSDAYAKGWEATVDGKPAPILVADYAFRATPVPAGRHRVAMRYRPLSARVGLWISFAMLFPCMGLLAGCVFRASTENPEN